MVNEITSTAKVKHYTLLRTTCQSTDGWQLERIEGANPPIKGTIAKRDLYGSGFLLVCRQLPVNAIYHVAVLVTSSPNCTPDVDRFSI